MKAVMISIQPKWCELIASGKKTIEVRKTAPKSKTPFKVYIYCTNSKEKLWVLKETERAFAPEKIASICAAKDVGGTYKANGKVIGEFICHNISEFESELWDDETYECIKRVVHTEDWESYPEAEIYYVAEDGEDNYLCRQSCLTWEDLRGYVGQDINTFFGWHISDLKIYDEPRELSEFKTKCKEYGSDNPNCTECNYYIDGMCYEYDESDCGCSGRKPITRPPQNWMYLEEEE